MKHSIDVQRLYRDNSRALVSGVCAGLARYWDCPTWVVRAGAIAAFLFMPVPVAIAYLMAIVLIRPR
ncbi:PspC domain-containing protein [Aestuariibacter salexigens]|uniref:PspC domain-containing protein n=1 Tax=Aestuariibacter salexigens TaxID=226010 RepID=UPI0003FD35A6|nr:PspC domain-containing protein [Aestuariibacter salexigens]